MARKEEIEITISEDGEVELHVQGVPGSDCMKLTEDLEEALGVVLNREKTNEFYQTPVKQDQHINIDENGTDK